jgi:hypothetical protein
MFCAVVRDERCAVRGARSCRVGGFGRFGTRWFFKMVWYDMGSKERFVMSLKFKFKSKDEIPADQLPFYAERDGVLHGHEGAQGGGAFEVGGSN